MNKLELLKKIKALADRGIDGEKISAQSRLEELMLKYNISESDISGDEMKDEYFFIDEADKRLFKQTVVSIMGDRLGETYVRRNKSTKKNPYFLNFKCTAADKIEIEFKWGLILQSYKGQQELFYTAFVRKNRLFNLDKEAVAWEDLTPEEQAEVEKADRLARGLQAVELTKQITA